MAVESPTFRIPFIRDNYVAVHLSDCWTRFGKPVRFRLAKIEAPEEEQHIWTGYNLIVLWFCFYVVWRRGPHAL